MVSTVRSLSNHYDTLRIKPTATSDEISSAFATQIKTARIRPDISVAQLAQISVAYETLRDPVRRRAYDASLGLNQEPKVQPRPPVTPEPRVASFIAASLREPVSLRETERRPQPDPVPEQWPVPKGKQPSVAVSEPAPRVEMPARPRVDLAFEPRDERRTFSIERKQATIGAGVAGLAILALAMILPHRQPAAPELATAATAAAQAVTVGLPPATTAQDQTALPVQVPAAAAASTHAAAHPDGGNAAAAADSTAAASTDQVQTTQAASDQEAAQSTATGAATQQAAAQPPSAVPAADESTDAAPAATIPAKLPLPEATIARTIERIGYACGSIVSSSTVSPGVFKIVCSSGDSYQAAPVGGRYRFHRWGSH